jgi:hypothetical protein
MYTSQVAFRSQPSDIVFNIAGAWKVFTEPAESTCPSRCVRSLCPPFGVFLRAVPRFYGSARVARTVLMRSNNLIPSG